ncbi:MAG TPA: YdeI/OmpD-associated family protein [Candidatus Kapabacteria bacterium]|jgi:uncharacterized protein YdeI (YjbR/CyaY-like superfamily)
MAKKIKTRAGISFEGMNPSIDRFFAQAKQWREEMEKLRTILLDCHLTEEWKWSLPCYSYERKNVVVIQPFKKYCALLFFKGVLLEDTDGILVKTGANTMVGRQIRFSNVRDIAELEPVLKTYLYQAIEVEKAGLKVTPKPAMELNIPEELEAAFQENSKLKKAFYALTPGRRRGYVFYFSQPKQARTRAARIEKYTPLIFDGKGMNDDYIQKRQSREEMD